MIHIKSDESSQFSSKTDIAFEEMLNKFNQNDVSSLHIYFSYERPAKGTHTAVTEFGLELTILDSDIDHEYTSKIKAANQDALVVSLIPNLKRLFAAVESNSSLNVLGFGGDNYSENQQACHLAHYTLANLLDEKRLKNKENLYEFSFVAYGLQLQSIPQFLKSINYYKPSHLILEDVNFNDTHISDLLKVLHKNKIALDQLDVIGNKLTEVSFINIVRYFYLYGAPDTFAYYSNKHALSRKGILELVPLLQKEETQMSLILSNQQIDDIALRPFVDNYLSIRRGLNGFINLSENCLSDYIVNEIIEHEKRIADARSKLTLSLDDQTPNETLIKIRFGSEAEVNQILHEYNLDELIELRDSLDNGILHLLAFRGNVFGLTHMLSVIKDFNVVNKDGQTPFMYAIQSKNKECINWFIVQGALKSIKVYTPIFQALSIANSAQVFDFIYSKLKPNAIKQFLKTHRNTSFIHELIYKGAANLLEHCLNKPEFYPLRNKRIVMTGTLAQLTPVMYLLKANLSEEKALSVLQVLLNFTPEISPKDVEILERWNISLAAKKIRSTIFEYYYLNQFFRDMLDNPRVFPNDSLACFQIVIDTRKNLKPKYDGFNIITLMEKVAVCFEAQFHQTMLEIGEESQTLNVSIAYHEGFSQKEMAAIQQQLISHIHAVRQQKISRKSTPSHTANLAKNKPKSDMLNRNFRNIQNQAQPDVQKQDKPNEVSFNDAEPSTRAHEMDSTYKFALMSLVGNQRNAISTGSNHNKSTVNTVVTKRNNHGETNHERKRREAHMKRQQREEKKREKIDQAERSRARVEAERVQRQREQQEQEQRHLDEEVRQPPQPLENAEGGSSDFFEDVDINKVIREFKSLDTPCDASDDYTNSFHAHSTYFS